MKIPETSANVGAYYGNEENGQWQPNGVIIDSGVGGGVVGSGDAGIHRPSVYPVHIPRGHIPGYVMAGAYYPPAAYPPPAPVPPPQDDFADYMWMENEEEFDKQVMQQLEEEALMEQCIEAMLEDEQREQRQQRPQHNGHNHYPTTSNGNPSLSLEEAVSRSTLNPLAAEFVPTRCRQPTQSTEDKAEAPPEAPSTQQEAPSTEHDAPPSTDSKADVTSTEDSKTEELLTPSTETPEVSAADLDKRPKEKREQKKPQKTEIKKTKPQAVKSETKVQPKKRDVKVVKSEMKIEVDDILVVEAPKPQPSPAEEPAPSGPKPINYAAAAKANKPKKPTASPPPITLTEKTQKATERTEKIKKIDSKPLKTDTKSIPRKNSNK